MNHYFGSDKLNKVNYLSIDWFKGTNAGKYHISWENLWFPAGFPLSQPIESIYRKHGPTGQTQSHAWKVNIVAVKLFPSLNHMALAGMGRDNWENTATEQGNKAWTWISPQLWRQNGRHWKTSSQNMDEHGFHPCYAVVVGLRLPSSPTEA